MKTPAAAANPRGDLKAIYGKPGVAKTLASLEMIKKAQAAGLALSLSLEQPDGSILAVDPADAGARDGIFVPAPSKDKLAEAVAKDLQRQQQRRNAETRRSEARRRLQAAQRRAARLENAILDLTDALQEHSDGA